MEMNGRCGTLSQAAETLDEKTIPENAPTAIIARMRTPTMNAPSVSVYDAVASHQAAEQHWFYHGVVQEIHRWREIFNFEFKLELTPTVFRIGGARSGCYGHFRPQPNDFGLPREIAFNERHLLSRLRANMFWHVIGTLLHELLHAWQFDHGKPSSRNHHNTEFRDKAAELGLVISYRGITDFDPKGRFFELVSRHGVRTPDLDSYQPRIATDSAPGSKLKKWRCDCTNVRVAVADFRAQCLKCGRNFVEQ